MKSTDILNFVLHEVMRVHPSFTETQAQRLLPELRKALGGQEHYVSKGEPVPGKPHASKATPPAVAAAVYRDALTTMSTEEIVSKHGISRRTMYRLLKRGPG